MHDHMCPSKPNSEQFPCCIEMMEGKTCIKKCNFAKLSENGLGKVSKNKQTR